MKSKLYENFQFKIKISELYKLIDDDNVNELSKYIEKKDKNEFCIIRNRLMFYACNEGKYNTVDLLLKQGAISLDYCQAVSIVCEKGYIDILELLLEQDDIDINCWQPLSKACENQHMDIVKLLLKQDNIERNKHVHNMLLKL